MSASFTASNRLTPDQMVAVRSETIFTCCKWDPQVEDVSVLSDFALLLSGNSWRHLAVTAEALYRETLVAEQEIAHAPHLIKLLGLPAPLESVLLAQSRRPDRNLPDEPRIMRFDFHATVEGWRISEVNSDVPGGYIESTGFSSIMARHCQGYELTADPVAALVSALRRRRLASGAIGLVHATAYTDDRQVMVFLQRALKKEGMAGRLLSPADIEWSDGRALAAGESLSALLRFFPVEWLPNLRNDTWKIFFDKTVTAQLNPGQAVLSQGKRFPLTWPYLSTPLSNWTEMLPETLPWRDEFDADWVSKPVFGRVGDGIGLNGVTTETEWKTIRKDRARKPGLWIAQRKFTALGCETPVGVRYPCFGVYVIDGQASGVYGRISHRPLIDHLAQDIAVLVPSSTTLNKAIQPLMSA